MVGVRRRARRASLGVALVAALVALVPATGQDAPQPNLPAWAPRWRKGDWWVVKTYQRDTAARTASPTPATGGTPAAPPDPLSDPLPGLPPLRDGVPEGWKPGNRFRFEAVRKEQAHDEAEEEEGVTAERFIVIAVRTLEGTPTRTAELWYTESDLTLAKVVVEPGSPAPRVHELWGTVMLDTPPSAELGLPLDWPDFAAAREAQAEVEVDGRPTVEQRVRTTGEGAEQEAEVLLVEASDRPDAPRARARMAFKAGQPFWRRIVTGAFMAELTESGTGPR